MRWIPGTTIADLEKMAILDAMKFYEGRRNDAAEALGISVRTLYNKLEEYAKEDELKAERENQETLRRENWLREQRGQPLLEIDQPTRSDVPDTIDDYAVSLPRRPQAAPAEIQADDSSSSPQKAVGGRRGR